MSSKPRSTASKGGDFATAARRELTADRVPDGYEGLYRMFSRHKDDTVASRSYRPELFCAVCLAAGGGVAASALADGRWGVVGAAVGAVTGAFAPTVYEALRDRQARDNALRDVVERRPPISWARLLDPRLEVVEFIGRRNELASLLAWCNDSQAARVLLVTGPGGVGKTRLAIELARQLRQMGWIAERVADGQETGAIAALRATTGRHALLTVDYAEARVGLGRMLEDLITEVAEGIRVLLLARSPGDWWDQLGVGRPAVWDLIKASTQGNFELVPEVAPEISDDDIVEMAVETFAERLLLPKKQVEVLGDSDDLRRMLDLHAAALVAVLRDSPTPAKVKLDMVFDELLRHEEHYWYQSAKAHDLYGGYEGPTQRALRQIVAGACLVGAASEEEARALPARVPGMSASVKVAEWLRVLYPPHPGDAEWIGSLQPDRLAELHVVRELTASEEFATCCLSALSSTQALRAVTLLARASGHDEQAATLLSRTLPDVAELLASEYGNADKLAAIFNAIPFPTVSLAGAALTIGERILTSMPPDADPALRAYWLRNIAVRHKGLGHVAEAMPLERDAVAILRHLTALNPKEYRRLLAMSLGNHAATLARLGQISEAVTVAAETVSLYREMVVHSLRYRSDLAWSLTNLGVCLSEAERFDEALAACTEAVVIGRKLVTENPARYRADLASWLTNFGARLAEMNRPEEAISPFEEAVVIARELAESSPDRYSANFGAFLINYGEALHKLDRASDALQTFEEAASIFRVLYAARPELFLPYLAQALKDLEKVYSSLGRSADATSTAEEAARISAELAGTEQDKTRQLSTNASARGESRQVD
jgi:tetratricopeptide (TPR) repeat protein/DNA polymerase III delta prime subunit